MIEWTAERVDALTRLWGAGLSASHIAAELGEDVTRNAVIGKLHRMRLARQVPQVHGNAGVPRADAIVARALARREEIARQRQQAAAQKRAERLRAREQAQAEARWPAASRYGADTAALAALAGDAWEALPGAPAPVPLLALESGQCKWPIGDRPFGFCGCTALAGRPYCAVHTTRAETRVAAAKTVVTANSFTAMRQAQALRVREAA